MATSADFASDKTGKSAPAEESADLQYAVLRAVIESSASPIFAVDRNYCYTAFNASHAAVMKALFGRDIAVGASILDYHLSPTDRSIAQGHLDRALSGEVVHVEYYCGDDAFERRYFAISHNPIRGTGGQITGVAVFAQDLTERNAAEERLRRSEAQLRQAQRVSRVGSWVWHIQSNRLEWSDEMHRIFGIDKAAFTGDLAHVIARAIHPDDRAAVERANLLVARDGKAVPIEYRVIWPDQTVHVVWAEAGELLLDSAGRRAILTGIVQEITERKRAEQAQRESEEKFAKAFLASPEAMSIASLEDGTYIDVNEAFARMTGFRRDQIVGQASVALGLWLDPEDRRRYAEQLRSDGRLRGYEVRVRVRSGDVRDVAVSSEIVSINGRECSLNFILDTTDRKRTERTRVALEAQLAQAQKMEAIGRLAGGVAHDFRNQLTVIKGYGEMLLRRPLVSSEGQPLVREILGAAGRGTQLTGQLLAFSRKDMLQPHVVDLARLVGEMTGALGRLLGEDILLEIRGGERFCPADLAAAQFEHAMMNLAANARDAMPEGGRLMIETRCIELDDPAASLLADARAGAHVRVSVTDTGGGMDKRTMARLFEPFFTTKKRGEGTGLGLAMVYGFVKQSGGFAGVESEPGRVSTVNLYFPRASGPIAAAPAVVPDAGLQVGSETLLIVEDEGPIRRLLTQSLTEAGYTVLEAADARDALQRARGHPATVHMLITDVVMPGVSGVLLAEAIRQARPNIPVLFVSGYAATDLANRGIALGRSDLLVKPFKHADLLATVRRMLDAARDGSEYRL